MKYTRRDILKIGSIGGITLFLGSPMVGHAAEAQLTFGKAGWGPTGAPISAGRIDAWVKVTGAKVFARDIRARDVEGWPEDQAHALILRIGKADRPYLGLDLSGLSEGATPDRVVTSEDLTRDGIDFPPFYTDHMLLPEGEVAPILGQAVAILIFHTYESFRAAKMELQFREDIFRFGEVESNPVHDPWGAFRIVRIAGEDGTDVFSSLNDATIKPTGYQDGKPIWPSASADGEAAERGMFHAEEIGAYLADPPANVQVFERSYMTQSTDAVTLEAENANIWYDPDGETLHMVVSVQDPHEVLVHAAEMLEPAKIPVSSIVLHPTYTVSYGSKDSSNHTYYALVAALYGDGRPVRTALDRFEQFQAALKRHPYDMDYTIAVDEESGEFLALRSNLRANGGGRPSFSNIVVASSTYQSHGIYAVPKTDLLGVAERTRALDASAIRGFGLLQAMCGLEMMVDEIADTLEMDAIDMRLVNTMRTGDRNGRGAMPSGQLRIVEVLDRARAHPIWTQRNDLKSAYEAANPDSMFGVGFACAQNNFGTGGEAAFAKVEFAEDGALRILHCGVETGTGLATTQAIVCAEWLGREADVVQTGVTDWSDLPIIVTGNTFVNTQEFEDEAMRDPDWSPRAASASGASNVAYYFSHATREAARIVAEFGIWPAALALWGPALSSERPTYSQARWVDGRLTAAGMEPLTWDALVAKAYAMGGVTGAAVHSFNRWQWAEADYALGPETRRLPIDGLSIRNGNALYSRITRQHVSYPPVQRMDGGATHTSSVATLVSLAINRSSGEVALQDVHSILECGRVMSMPLVSGQMQGAIAMGVGHALYEELPLYEDGPGAGNWNLGRYRIPRATEVSPWRQTLEVLPPLSDTDPSKGFAEAAVIPIAPAIGNAIAHATGLRFSEFPIKASVIKERLA